LRPFAGYALTPFGVRIMTRLGVPRILGRDNERLVAESPLLLAACLTREEYREGELAAFYSVFGLAAALENVWLTTVELGMGIQFVSTPLEIPDARAELERILEVPNDLVLMAILRLGYLPADKQRPRIDWSSRHRKRLSQFVFRNTFRTPEPDPTPEPSSS
ncbi:MAG: nitroreductase, partial [Deltaproteobacteria bacterium]